MSGHMYKDGAFGNVLYNFYDEREWRYVPFGKLEELYLKNNKVKTFLEKQIFDDSKKREYYNEMIGKHCSLTFTVEEIKYLFVKDDYDKDVLIDFIEHEYMKGANKKNIQNLISKIYVLETFFQDI